MGAVNKKWLRNRLVRLKNKTKKPYMSWNHFYYLTKFRLFPLWSLKTKSSLLSPTLSHIVSHLEAYHVVLRTLCWRDRMPTTYLSFYLCTHAFIICLSVCQSSILRQGLMWPRLTLNLPHSWGCPPHLHFASSGITGGLPCLARCLFLTFSELLVSLWTDSLWMTMAQEQDRFWPGSLSGLVL